MSSFSLIESFSSNSWLSSFSFKWTVPLDFPQESWLSSSLTFFLSLTISVMTFSTNLNSLSILFLFPRLSLLGKW